MAGFFGFFDYNRPGKGVEKDAPPKPRFFLFFELFFRKFWKMIQLNFLTVLTGIPLLLVMLLFAPVPQNSEDMMGYASLILYVVGCLMYFSVVGFGVVMPGIVYILRNFAGERHAWVWSDFWDHIRKNWKQSLALTVIDAVLVFLFSVSIRFYGQQDGNTLYLVAKYFVWVFAGVWYMMHYYLYQMMVTFDLKLVELIRNAFIFTMAKLPMNLLMLIVVFAISFAAVYFTGVGIILFILMLPVFMNFMITFYAQKAIRIHMIPPDEEEVQRLEEEGLL